MAGRIDLIRRVGALCALVFGGVLVALVALQAGLPDGVASLAGRVPARVERDGQDLGVVPLTLPGQLTMADLRPDDRVTVQWTVTIPEGAPRAWGVWIERPQYASRLTWDGRVVGQTGQVDGASRSESSLLAAVPGSEPGEHTLTLVVQGDYGKGGVIGRLVHGPLDAVIGLSRRVESAAVGLVLLLCALGAVQLGLAARRTRRPASLFLGLLCLAIALYLLFRTDLATLYVPEALPGIRLRRFATAWIGPVALGLAATFDRTRTPSWVGYLLGGAGVVSLSALVLPAGGLAFLEVALDAALLASAVMFIVLVVPVAWRGRPGAMLLVLGTAAPMGYGVVAEILVTNGFMPGGAHLLPTIGLFAIGATLAVIVRDAQISERHDRLIRGTSDGMLTVDSEGRIVHANPAAAGLFGRSPVGTSLVDWVASEDQPLVRAHVAVDDHRPGRAEFRLRGQERIVESVGTWIGGRGHHLLALRDVTQRRRMDQGLLQAARMETLAVLVGGIAHDFNNVLGTLLAHVGFLQVVGGDDPPVQKRLGRMETTIERASVLTRRLAALSGGTGGTLAPTDLSRVVREATELLRPTLEERVELEVDVPPTLPRVAASATDLEHILVQLVVNARDAVGRTGRIAVVARPFRAEDGVEGILLAVEDDGPGVPLELRETIFAPFFTTKDDRHGTGLGLAVATQLVREHHGRLWVEDRPGGGARFCLALHDARVLDTDVPEHDVEGLPVLVVEDEAVLRDTFAHALEKAGFDVTALPDGSAAVAALQEQRPTVLVTDVLMPGLNGIELARLARGMHPDVPVLLVSGYIPDDAGLLDDPMLHRLDKPIRASRLVAMVERLARVATRRAEGDDTTVDDLAFPPLDEVSWESVHWGTPAPPPHGSASPDQPADGPPTGA